MKYPDKPRYGTENQAMRKGFQYSIQIVKFATKIRAMTTVIINERTTKGKRLVEYLRTLDYVRIQDRKPTPELEQAMKEAREGNVIRAKNTDELLRKLKE
jgi:hypothetical protein